MLVHLDTHRVVAGRHRGVFGGPPTSPFASGLVERAWLSRTQDVGLACRLPLRLVETQRLRVRRGCELRPPLSPCSHLFCGSYSIYSRLSRHRCRRVGVGRSPLDWRAETMTPNHALQRTASPPSVRASREFASAPCAPPAPPRPSLSLGR